MLATVQSALTAGLDSSTALSRLMDWAEAREVSDDSALCKEPYLLYLLQAAIAAFASDEGEEIPAPIPRPRPTAVSRSISNINNPHARSVSAPIPEHAKLPNTNQAMASTSTLGASLANRSRLSSDVKNETPLAVNLGDHSEDLQPQGEASVSRAMLASTDPYPAASSSTSTPVSNSTTQYQPTPQQFLSSPTSMSTSSVPRHFNHPTRQSKHSTKYSHHQSSPSTFVSPSASSSTPYTHNSSTSYPTRPPSSNTFNPAIPSAGVPFVSFAHSDSPSGSGQGQGPGMIPSQQGNTGSKRPLIMDTEMMDDVTPSSGPITPVVTLSQPILGPIAVQGQRGGAVERGRSAKRRNLAKDEGEKDDRVGGGGDRAERRRGGRRH